VCHLPLQPLTTTVDAEFDNKYTHTSLKAEHPATTAAPQASGLSLYTFEFIDLTLGKFEILRHTVRPRFTYAKPSILQSAPVQLKMNA
jgi:hypothetical protein